MFLLLATTVAFAVQDAPRVSLISYEETVRCAGLAQAASELEGGESTDGKSLFDVALYWSLAAGQAATASGKAPAVADADQNRARILAVRQLNAGDDDARAMLRRCRARTPDLG
ncbi:MAG: hypothetical protein JWR59_2161 [Brevundimonas sp.]|nr:hypothetical protein [Brevundimonas sp.]